jgi:hypothetical protein
VRFTSTTEGGEGGGEGGGGRGEGGGWEADQQKEARASSAGHGIRQTERLAAESNLIDVVQQLNTCAQEMKRHVDSNVYKGPGRVHTPSSELRLSKLTVADIAGWVERIGTLSKKALSGVGDIESALEAELVVKQSAIASLVQDAQRRQVHLAAAEDECDAILQAPLLKSQCPGPIPIPM